MDTWGRKAPVVLPAAAAQADPCPVDEDGVERAAKLLGGAQRPLIVVGGGAQGAGEYVARIAEMLDAPVMTGRMGQGVIDGRHRLSVTSLAGYRFWSEADVVLAVGTRLQPQQMNWGMDDDLKIIRIDIDGEELDRQKQARDRHHRRRRRDAGSAGQPARRAQRQAQRPRRSGRRDQGRGDRRRSATRSARRSPISRRSARRCRTTASWSMS